MSITSTPNTTTTTTQGNKMSNKQNTVSNSYNTIVRTGGFDLRVTSTGPKIVHSNLQSRLNVWVALPVIDGDDTVSVKITGLGFSMLEEGEFEGFYENLQEIETIANDINEAWIQYNCKLDHQKWENEELSTGEVAELMGFSAEMIRRWCIEGKIKSRETSRGRKITRKEAFRFMETHPKFNN